MTILRATPNPRGGRVDLAFELSTPHDAVFPAVSLVRRRSAFPRSVADGLSILDVAELRRTTEGWWARVEHRAFVVGNSPAEGGLVQLEVTAYFETSTADVPARVRVRTSGPGRRAELLSGTLRVERGDAHVAFHDHLGEQGLLSWSESGSSGGQVTWSGRALSLEGLRYEHRLEDAAVIESHARDGVLLHRIRVRRAGSSGLLLQAHIRERFDTDTGQWQRELRVEDRVPSTVPSPNGELEPQTYYYGLFEAVESGPSALVARAIARASARYGFGRDPSPGAIEQHRLYGLLPAVLRRLDEPSASDAGTGQLRSFMEIFGAGLDHIRSLAEALRERHDLHEARADLLRPLAQYVGWPLDLTRDEITQRFDIASATEVYRSVGTVANLAALINRATGREVKVKEYVHNVAFTNAIEPRRVSELWARGHDGAAWEREPRRLPVSDEAVTERFQGRPSLCIDGTGQRCIGWHAPDAGSWQILIARESASFAPVPIPRLPQAMLGELDPCVVPAGDPARVDDLLLLATIQRDPTRSDVVLRRLDAELRVVGEPVWLTDRQGVDRWPAVVHVGPRSWVFWQSDRSGIPAIWGLTVDGIDPEGSQSEPMRLTDGRDETPAAAVDVDGAPWVVWSRDAGDRSSLWSRHLEGGRWMEPQPVEGPEGEVGRFRDRAPALARFRGRMWLVWESDRPDASGTRRQRLWARERGVDGWGAATIVADSHTAEAEPALLTVGTGATETLLLAWRSQRRSTAAWTRTLDTRDSELLARMGTYEDRVHYTYDTGRTDDDWYAGDTVGLFFETSEADADAVAREVERMRSFVEPFRPAHVRLVWHLPRLTRYEEPVHGFTDELHDTSIAWLYTWSPSHRDGRTVDTGARPVDLRGRIVDTDLLRLANT